MNAFKQKLTLALMSLILVCPLAALAQWNRKSYTEWDERDALRVLHDSPWGKTEVFSNSSSVKTAVPDRDADANRTIDVGGSRVSRTAQVNFRICFLSARPIRQAISRLIELKQGSDFDKRFAAQLKSFVDDDYPDQVIISVFFDSPRPSTKYFNAREMLENLTTDKLKEKTYLSVESGQRVYLQEYLPPRNDGLGARFAFPRMVDGKPLVSLDNFEVIFHAELSDQYRLDRRFKVRDMIYKNRLEY